MVGQELGGHGVVLEGFDGGGIEGCFAAEGGGNDDFALGGEDFVGVCELRL